MTRLSYRTVGSLGLALLLSVQMPLVAFASADTPPNKDDDDDRGAFAIIPDGDGGNYVGGQITQGRVVKKGGKDNGAVWILAGAGAALALLLNGGHGDSASNPALG